MKTVNYSAEAVVLDDRGSRFVSFLYQKAESEEKKMQYDGFAVGDVLRDIRSQHNFTQNEMAEKLDVSYIHYSQIEQGRHKMSLELMLRIASEFDIEPNMILGVMPAGGSINAQVDELKRRLTALKPEEREYVVSAWNVFLDGFNARKDVAFV